MEKKIAIFKEMFERARKMLEARAAEQEAKEGGE